MTKGSAADCAAPPPLSAAAGNDRQAGILLEVDYPGKQKSQAVQAQLDADVSAAIFNPESVH